MSCRDCSATRTCDEVEENYMTFFVGYCTERKMDMVAVLLLSLILASATALQQCDVPGECGDDEEGNFKFTCIL